MTHSSIITASPNAMINNRNILYVTARIICFLSQLKCCFDEAQAYFFTPLVHIHLLLEMAREEEWGTYPSFILLSDILTILDLHM